jgi:ubiquinone/menaquinone biosynthesis C-methylase UbiE
MGEYPLGTKPAELERLALQQDVWGPLTARLLERAGPLRGGRVVDLGCGPGLLLDEWLARVGPRGEIVLVDEAERWHEHLAGELARRGARNVRLVRARLEELELEPASVELFFARWVFSFLPDPAGVLARLAPALRPGGRIAIQDYNHEGVSLFPESAGFRAVIRATRAWYAEAGGDTFVAGRLPRILRAAGFELVELRPNVLCGGPASPAFRWADAFFPLHVDTMVARDLLSADERALFLAEWAARKADPDALFFSPMVVDALARRPC